MRLTQWLLDQAVGEAQHSVAALEHLLADLGIFTAEADRQGGRACQLPDDPVVADQQWCGVAGVDPLQVTRRDVQTHYLRGDEMVGPELLGDRPVHERVDLGQADAGTSGVPVGPDGDGRHRGGVQAVAHRVDHGHVQDVFVEGVVEAVACDVVGGLQDSGDRDLRVGHRQRRQQGPLDLRGHAHRFAAPGEEELVGVAVLGDQRVGDQTGEPAQQPSVVVIDGVQGEGHHAHLVAAVQQWQVHPDAVGLRHLGDGRVQEGRAGGRVVDRLGLADCQLPTR